MGSTYHAANCGAREFDTANSQGTSQPLPDWAYGYFKGQCSAGQFVKGVSKASSGFGGVREILCCDKTL